MSDATLGEADAVEELLAACLRLPPSERVAELDRICAEHPDQAERLRSRARALERTLSLLATDPFEVPERLGDFRILRRLGGGGMGVVYEAEQASLGRTVALKLIRPEQLYFPKARERFRREAQAAAALQHPGIVPVHSVGESEGIPFFAMERFRGCTLAEVLTAVAGRAPESLSGEDLARAVARAAGEPCLPSPHFDGTWIDACIEVTRRVALALEHAHSNEIVHRDVKPSNVAVTADGRVMLFDFGLTHVPGNERLTNAGSTMGTLPYMSPEQVRDAHRVGAQSDIYSLGVMLYELLTLQLPFDRASEADTRAQILGGRPDSLRSRNRKVAADLETVCLVAMDVDPARRYPSAGAFAEDLASLAAHRPIRARPPGPLLRARRWGQRRPTAATAIALSAVLVAGIPSALFLQERAHAESLRLANQEVSDALLKEKEALEASEAARQEASRSRTRAARSADVAERTLGFVSDMFYRISPINRPGPRASIPEMLLLGADDADVALAAYPAERGRVQLMLGQFFVEFGRFPDAIESLDASIASLETAVAADDLESPDTVDRLYEAKLSLSDALRHVGDLDRSETLALEHAAWAREGGRSDLLVFSLSSLSAIYALQARYEESDAVYAELLPLLDEGSEELAVNLLNHGRSLSDRGRNEEALAQIERGSAILERLFTPPHGRLVHAKIALGVVLANLELSSEAEAVFVEADEMAQAVWGATNHMSAIARYRLALLARARNDIEAAREHARAALALYRDVFGDGSPETIAAAGLATQLNAGG